MAWINFKTTMYAQYNRMLAEREGGTLANDVYEAFNVIATEDTTVLTKFIVRSAKRSARPEARVNILEARMEAMAFQQPVGLELPPQAENFANNVVYQPAMGPPPGFNSHQEYGFYAPQEQTTQMPHPGPFGTPNKWAQWS